MDYTVSLTANETTYLYDLYELNGEMVNRHRQLTFAEAHAMYPDDIVSYYDALVVLSDHCAELL